MLLDFFLWSSHVFEFEPVEPGAADILFSAFLRAGGVEISDEPVQQNSEPEPGE